MLCLQFKFNTRFHKGTGLADGEQSERLWSYLRKFGKITKEMTPSHRTDLLTDALLHYSAKVQRKQSQYVYTHMHPIFLTSFFTIGTLLSFHFYPFF